MQVLSSKLKETNPIYAARNCVTDKNNLKRIKELIKELFHTATFVLIFFFFCHRSTGIRITLTCGFRMSVLPLQFSSCHIS